MTKSEQLPNLCAAINRAQRIVRSGDVYTFSYSQITYAISERDIDAIDARLLPTLTYLLHCGDTSAPRALRQTIEHWLCPSPKHEHIENRYITSPSFIEASTTPNIYLLRANTYMTVTIVDYIEVAIPLNQDIWIPVTSGWLDINYPMVRHKIAVLDAMGLLKEEISKHAVANMGLSRQSVDVRAPSLDS